MLKLFRKMTKTPSRFLNLHEYQASELLSHYQLPVLRGGHANTMSEVSSLATSIYSQSKKGIVVKAQIHAGGRGRGTFKKSQLQSGVQIVKSPEEAVNKASQMLGDVLVTKQSGSQGKPVNTLYLVEEVALARELYVSIMLDRERARPVVIASPEGGVGIEEIDPSLILQLPLDPVEGLTEKDVSNIVSFMNLNTTELKETMEVVIKGLYKCFIEKDVTLVEVNPLGITEEGRMLICDSKLNVDDNSAPRQKSLFAQEDLSQKDSKEVRAEKFDLNYVKLEGDVGCLVNGAGLAMATMDLINFKGGKPANFLDVGGGTSTEKVKEAISIINDDIEVNSILINIFGGIVRCDVIAEGVIMAVKDLNIKKPIVMRIKGTNAGIAKELIRASGLDLHWCETVDEAADLALKLSK